MMNLSINHDDMLVRRVIGKVADEYGCLWFSEVDYNGELGMFRVRFEDMRTKEYMDHLFDMRSVKYRGTECEELFEQEVRKVLDDWKRDERNNSYRDILVEQIKSAGQQLIDRAEEMVSEKLTFVTGFTINVDIPQPADRPVVISWTAETIDTNQLK